MNTLLKHVEKNFVGKKGGRENFSLFFWLHEIFYEKRVER